MQSDSAGTGSSGTPGQIPVSPNNPCPFLRALVAGGFVSGHVVPLATLCRMVEAASGETGLKKKIVGIKTCMVALIANGLSPLRLWRSWRSGAVLDELRNGPLDKHGVGSRILGVDGQVNEAEIERLAGFGQLCKDPCGGTERGLTSPEITTYMRANFDRAKDNRRWYDPILMKGEWPVLLDIMGKSEGQRRYLSAAEVSTLFNERRLPERIVERLASAPAPATGLVRVAGKVAWGLAALAGVAIVLLVVVAEFPNQLGKILPQKIADLLPPPLPDLPSITEAHWLDQNWSLEDRHWFHHATQGTMTFPVPYDWFVALEQPGIHLITRPGLFKDSGYLERFGFLPSPKTIHTDQATLQRYGYYPTDAKTEPAPETVTGLKLKPTPVENFDGLPVGFARMSGAKNPATGEPEPDMIGLTCAACHTGHINYKGVSVRFDGGPSMVDLLKLERATGLAIATTRYLPTRFKRFANRVLGRNATSAQRDELKKGLSQTWDVVLGQVKALEKSLNDKHQQDTEEGYGRLDALNRIGNQVFATDMALSGVPGFDKNLVARNAPVSFPPIWTVPWLLWAQYDASIEQPLIRNAGEALGVSALLNFSPDAPRDTLFRSSVETANLIRIEDMLRGANPPGPNRKSFGGLQSPKWPAAIFPNDTAWKIDPARVVKGRALYGEICFECHLGPVDDPLFDAQFPDESIWKPEHWDETMGPALKPVQKSVIGMGTDPAQAEVLGFRKVAVPGFLDIQPARDLGKAWGCTSMPDPSSYSSTDMPYSIALMTVVDLVGRKWMDDLSMTSEDQKAVWGPRKNCPNDWKNSEYPAKSSPADAKKQPDDGNLSYRARPLNGVWATAPYLHNGSVPSLWWMLMPQAERPKQFCMGFRDFDPQQVGFHVEANEAPKCKTGETLFSTADSGGPIQGNSNLGHSLEAKPGEGAHEHKNGVIGRLLSDEERLNLIEYLKTL
ncbi:MAG TPA: di-heme-cytochrome C peroxidase [Bradyrhizobium sp.]|uniref:di-heme-cytochrome C peroxidase n=1 Tax=Bradyrhizobium sp. TaxID=376 RepID=UPI002CCC3143|nr:di-heme-cytochrome C peroxidase [Bradyrhizobium sp.]HTB00236.1 di-heme-cytochrome C peroxidase [Bradyrhizobium sp.]